MKGLLITLSMAALLFVASPGQALTIDHFEEGFFNISVDSTSPNAVDDQSGLTTVLGGRRRAELNWVAGNGAGLNISATALDQTPPPTDHWMDFAADTGLEGQLTLRYGLDGALGDLTEGGSNSLLAINFLLSDLGADVLVTLTDTAANSHGETQATGLGPNLMGFSFADYTAAGVDVTSIDTLTFQIDGVPSGDYRIDLIGAIVPEPLTMVGMAMGIGGLVRYTRKRRGRK